ncbi:MAG: methyltransferase domain-containing protein [Patescibacteria group bacterium]
MKHIIKNIKYYFWASYRRKILDNLLEKNKNYYKGTVLDIGGRDRGKFKKPKNEVEKWIFADIEEKHHPDIVLDVTDMHSLSSESIDTISAIELFEHVSYPEKGVAECQRILKKGGVLILSAPFLHEIHADPFDFQRWTGEKWKLALNNNGFEIIKIYKMGAFFTVLCDMIKNVLKKTGVFRYIFYFSYPFLDLLVKLDELSTSENSEFQKYIGGYFIITIKK